MMLVCMYLLSTKLDFPKKIEQFSKALLEISMMMLFSETSRFRLLLIMYYLQNYVFIDHTNSMMQINDILQQNTTKSRLVVLSNFVVVSTITYYTAAVVHSGYKK